MSCKLKIRKKVNRRTLEDKGGEKRTITRRRIKGQTNIDGVEIYGGTNCTGEEE